MTTPISSDGNPRHPEIEDSPTLDRKPTYGPPQEAPSFDPTHGRQIGSHPGDDPTQGGQIGSDPSDDPTQGRRIGSDPDEDPTRTR